MMEYTARQLTAAAGAALCVGIAKGGFGGAGMLAVLLMASAWPARESTGIILPMLIVGDLMAVRMFHRHARAKIVFRLLLPAWVGVICGWWVMPRIEASAFRPLIGWVALILVAMVILQRVCPRAILAVEKRRYAWPIGWAAGVTTMLANAAGPVTTIYMLACRLPKMEFVGTSAWFYLAINLSKVPFSASLGLVTPQTLLLNAAMAPIILLGVIGARALLLRVNQTLFEWLMIVFTVAGAVRLIMG